MCLHGATTRQGRACVRVGTMRDITATTVTVSCSDGEPANAQALLTMKLGWTVANNSMASVILECTDCRHKHQAVQAPLKRCGKCGGVLKPVEKKQRILPGPRP